MTGPNPLERECWRLAAKGLHNDDIVLELQRLGFRRIVRRRQVSDALWRVYRKLGLDARPDSIDKRVVAGTLYERYEDWPGGSAIPELRLSATDVKLIVGIPLSPAYLSTWECAAVARKLLTSSVDPDGLARFILERTVASRNVYEHVNLVNILEQVALTSSRQWAVELLHRIYDQYIKEPLGGPIDIGAYGHLCRVLSLQVGSPDGERSFYALFYPALQGSSRFCLNREGWEVVADNALIVSKRRKHPLVVSTQEGAWLISRLQEVVETRQAHILERTLLDHLTTLDLSEQKKEDVQNLMGSFAEVAGDQSRSARNIIFAEVGLELIQRQLCSCRRSLAKG